MNKPHKHAELIKAWADGAKIQWKDGEHWVNCINGCPGWFEEEEYRIKPEEKKPVVRWKWAQNWGGKWIETGTYHSEEEFKKKKHALLFVKLKYTRTEFPE